MTSDMHGWDADRWRPPTPPPPPNRPPTVSESRGMDIGLYAGAALLMLNGFAWLLAALLVLRP